MSWPATEPAIHREAAPWMAGSSPAMTESENAVTRVALSRCLLAHRRIGHYWCRFRGAVV